MPLSPEQKRQFLLEKGYDPDKYDLDEVPIGDGDNAEVETGVVPPLTGVKPALPNLNPSQAFMEGIKQSIVPSAASIGASAGALGLLSKFVPHPLIKIPGSILAGLGAGYAASKGQEEIQQRLMDPENYNKRLATQEAARTQHPKVNILGELIPSFAAFGPGGMLKVLGALGKITKVMAGAKAVTESEKVALGSAALNTGLAGGGEAIREGISGEGLDPSKIAIASLVGGALQNQPWGIGKRLYPSLRPPVETTVTPIKPIKSSVKPPPITIDTPKAFDPETLPIKQSIDPEIITELQGKEVKPSLETDQSIVVKTGEPPNRPAIEKDINPDPTEKYYQEGENKNYSKAWLSPDAKLTNVKDHEPGAFEIAKIPIDTDFSINTHTLLNKGWTRVTRGSNVIHFEGNPNNAQLRELKNLAIEEGKMLIEDGGKVIYDPDANINPGDRLYSEKSTKQQPIINKPAYELKPEDTELATKRGITLESVSEIISKTTGQPVRGEALPDQRKALITDIATPDTVPHEVGHPFLRDLKNSKLQADRDDYNRAVKLAGSEEALVEAGGLRYVDITNKPLRSWFEDFGSNVKRLTRIAESSKDHERIFARRLKDDRPYSESPEFKSVDDLTDTKPQVKTLYSEEKESTTTVNKADDESNPKPWIFKKFGAAIDKLKESGPLGVKAGDASERAFRDMDRYEGKITNALIKETKNIPRKEYDSVAAYIHKMRGYDIPDDLSIKPISPETKKIIDDKIHPILKHIIELQKELPYERYIKENPNYRGPIMLDPKVAEQLSKLPESSPVRKQLIDEFVDHQVKYNKTIKGDKNKAVGIYNDYIRGLDAGHGTTEFKALRKAEGSGLPFSWMDKDINRLFRRYGNRVAKDLAYFKHIESNPEVASLFGAGKKIEGQPALFNENLGTIKRLLQGDFTRKDAITDTAEVFTRSLILGPLTGVKNIVGSITKSLIYTPVRDLPKIGQSLMYLSKGLKDSLEMGSNRYNTLDIFTRNDEGISTIADNFRRVANLIRIATGANGLEQISRARTQAQGDLMARASVGSYAKSGDIQTAKFLNKFKDSEMSLETFKKGDVSEDTYKRIAANFVERIEGTYDARGLPGGLLEPTSMFYYLGSLSKWSVETGNIIKQDVINPLIKDNDWGPLLRYTLGSIVVAGPLISMINELFSGGKKSQYPNIKELEEKGSMDDYAHKILELGSLAGFMGIYGDLVKASMDLSKGMKPRGYNVPSIEIAADTLTEVVNASKAALDDGQPVMKVAIDLISNILIDNFQALRIVHSQFKPTEDVERANKFRDKRVYNRLDDKKIPAFSGDKPDRYGSDDINRFKESESFKESIDILTKEILPRIKDDPNKKNILEGMKRNSYQVMPSDPVERKKYYDYLVKTQGKEAADKLVKDKLMQDFLNQSKSKLVPKY